MTKEAIYGLMESFEGRFLNALMIEELIGTEPWMSLLDDLRGVKEVFKELSEEETFNYKEINIIDKLKLASNVISLKNSNYSDAEVANVLVTQTGQNILPVDVTNWLENYTNIGLSAKPQVLRGSIFDTQSRMQELHERMLVLLESIENKTDEDYKYTKTTKGEVELAVLSEMRQLTKDASGIITAISSLNRLKDFQQVVLEAIGTVSPQVQQAILRKLKEQKSIMGALMPPT